MPDLSHLNDVARSALDLPVDDRIDFALRDHWIEYPRAQEVLQALTDLLNQPRTVRVNNLLVVGRSGNGKTSILHQFLQLHPIDPRPEAALAPVVFMGMPSEPNETRFWSALLDALKVAHRDTDPVLRKQNQAKSVLTYAGCRMLMIDEVHNINYGHATKQRHFLGVLKTLSNDLRLPIVLAGTRDAIRTFHTDSQVASRWDVIGLPLWPLDAKFLSLLASFEEQLPLPAPSDLQEKQLAIKLHNLSHGNIGQLAKIIKGAAANAIRKGKDRIDRKYIDEIKFVPVEDYGRQADTL